ncbi:Aspartyl/glutamyl-tRNA(Asn/Gln) amidotransferase subunit C [Candidatus Promineifilum breve]|uniref:Aspartyl/glutamyl-tRNA(Asn/Gln) amidotransferase subunit C n=1 Tax=Candidatus Promineifilum breve TaxID=1806508 RepID=A0A160T0C7_9CHLR|nr:Asp-tRNA(Asn)/Glu-tRNA(Gln) amidotransferase subunit GatC [Candidatus Promineifilum breve]CUS03196.2 Aspartyl/glutamyl-tRNA(Asn/Gln) amidotransferase subunit C [Candidatus Promineifilum breve]
MSLSHDEVARIAHLARLALTEEELNHYGAQLSAILEYAARLNELDVSGMEPAAQPAARRNVMRDDAITPSLPTEDALFNAAATAEGQFFIQAVLDE